VDESQNKIIMDLTSRTPADVGGTWLGVPLPRRTVEVMLAERLGIRVGDLLASSRVDEVPVFPKPSGLDEGTWRATLETDEWPRLWTETAIEEYAGEFAGHCAGPCWWRVSVGEEASTRLDALWTRLMEAGVLPPSTPAWRTLSTEAVRALPLRVHQEAPPITRRARALSGHEPHHHHHSTPRQDDMFSFVDGVTTAAASAALLATTMHRLEAEEARQEGIVAAAQREAVVDAVLRTELPVQLPILEVVPLESNSVLLPVDSGAVVEVRLPEEEEVAKPEVTEGHVLVLEGGGSPALAPLIADLEYPEPRTQEARHLLSFEPPAPGPRPLVVPCQAYTVGVLQGARATQLSGGGWDVRVRSGKSLMSATSTTVTRLLDVYEEVEADLPALARVEATPLRAVQAALAQRHAYIVPAEAWFLDLDRPSRIRAVRELKTLCPTCEGMGSVLAPMLRDLEAAVHGGGAVFETGFKSAAHAGGFESMFVLLTQGTVDGLIWCRGLRRTALGRTFAPGVGSGFDAATRERLQALGMPADGRLNHCLYIHALAVRAPAFAHVAESCVVRHADLFLTLWAWADAAQRKPWLTTAVTCPGSTACDTGALARFQQLAGFAPTVDGGEGFVRMHAPLAEAVAWGRVAGTWRATRPDTDVDEAVAEAAVRAGDAIPPDVAERLAAAHADTDLDGAQGFLLLRGFPTGQQWLGVLAAVTRDTGISGGAHACECGGGSDSDSTDSDTTDTSASTEDSEEEEEEEEDSDDDDPLSNKDGGGGAALLEDESSQFVGGGFTESGASECTAARTDRLTKIEHLAAARFKSMVMQRRGDRVAEGEEAGAGAEGV
jgi:hypothetical protein